MSKAGATVFNPPMPANNKQIPNFPTEQDFKNLDKQLNRRKIKKLCSEFREKNSTLNSFVKIQEFR